MTNNGADAAEQVTAVLSFHRHLAARPNWCGLLEEIVAFVNRVIPHEYARLALGEEAALTLSVSETAPAPDTACGTQAVPTSFAPPNIDCVLFGEGIESAYSLPLATGRAVLGVLHLASRDRGAFASVTRELAEGVAAQVSLALDYACSCKELESLKSRLAEQKIQVEEDVRLAEEFSEILGNSAAMKRVLHHARIVARTDATVLILGETGTGKELIARAIHRLSHRSERRFVTINCAAIPTGLFESELFGHEKGAFTGALTQKIGRLELADGGTLLLDEVGDILPELQPKLLRVLQDGEFERLGSMQTNRVNVRLITATNRDLSEKLAEGTFRRDLFYRLNVFPLQMPTLRERREDIPMLVRHFVRKFSDKGDQTIKTIPQSMMRALQQWNWPGNVRELEHFIHRAVIMTKGTVLYDCLPDPVTVGPERVDRTLKAVERDHILEVLRGAGGKLAGKWGAATKLGLKRTTLQSKMRELGIQRSDYDPNKGTG